MTEETYITFKSSQIECGSCKSTYDELNLNAFAGIRLVCHSCYADMEDILKLWTKLKCAKRDMIDEDPYVIELSYELAARMNLLSENFKP